MLCRSTLSTWNKSITTISGELCNVFCWYRHLSFSLLHSAVPCSFHLYSPYNYNSNSRHTSAASTSFCHLVFSSANSQLISLPLLAYHSNDRLPAAGRLFVCLISNGKKPCSCLLSITWTNCGPNPILLTISHVSLFVTCPESSSCALSCTLFSFCPFFIPGTQQVWSVYLRPLYHSDGCSLSWLNK